jgi:hypothetical protein
VSCVSATSHISWGLIVQDCGDMVSYHLPHHQGASSQTPGRRSQQAPTDSLIWRGIPPGELGVRALDAQRNPVRCRNQQGVGNTAHQTGKNRVRIQACLRRQKESFITSQRLLVTMVKLCLSGLGSRVEILCCVRVCESVSLTGSPAAKPVRSLDPRAVANS